MNNENYILNKLIIARSDMLQVTKLVVIKIVNVAYTNHLLYTIVDGSDKIIYFINTRNAARIVLGQ